MEQLAKFLKFETTKYSDLSLILEKLDSHGYINELYNILKKIFTNEANFTFQELKKLSETDGHKFNIDNQFKLNSNIFKINFSLIMNLLIDNVYESVSNLQKLQLINPEELAQLNDPKRADLTIDLGNGTGRVQEKSVIHEETSISSLLKSRGNSPQTKSNTSPKASNRNNLRKSPSPTRPESILAVVANEKKLKTSSSILSTNNIQSPLQTILGTNSNNTSMQQKSVKNSNNTSFVNPSQKNNQSIMNTSKSLNANKMNSSTNLNISKGSMNASRIGDVSVVHSEFNYITGPVSFTTSKRNLDMSMNNSPGPSAYQPEKSEVISSKTRRSPSPTIGKAIGGTWIETVTKTESPGPGGLYPSMHFVSK